MNVILYESFEFNSHVCYGGETYESALFLI